MKECPVCNVCFEDKIKSCPRDGNNLEFAFPGPLSIEGKYEIRKKLGQGGMGAVYEAVHIMLGKVFALKVVRPKFIMKNPNALDMFTREARTTATIRHPNVVSVTDFGITEESVPYLVMEYIEGITFYDFLKKTIPLDSEQLIVIFYQICAGLENAHNKGIIHRDIKPDNILIDTSLDLSNGVKVSDFGIAGILREGYYEKEFENLPIGGTPLFMSPEQCRGKKWVDQKADIYSVGIMLYFSLTGKFPFWSNSVSQLLMKHMNELPPDPRMYNANISEKMVNVITKSLSKNPNDRYQSTMEMFLDIKSADGIKTARKQKTHKEKEIAIGIDLGTSNSVVSLILNGKTVVVNVDGINRIMPSVIGFRSKNERLIGKSALKRAIIDPDHTILNVKRKIGDRSHHYTVYDSYLTPVEISSMILRKLIDSAEEYLRKKIKKAVITVPAYFNEEQRKATKEAGELAGLEIVHLLSEPTAAAISYGMDQHHDQILLVYDLGGGTFDVSILKVKSNAFDVLAVGGDHDLGGNDFDSKLMDLVLLKIKKEKNIEINLSSSDKESLRIQQMLLFEVKRAKQELSESLTTHIDLPNFYKGESFSFNITRKEFEDLIKPLIQKTINIVSSTIVDAGLEIDDIDRLILVGGSTRMPIVKRMVEDSIREPYIAKNVDEIVSVGAAIMADQLNKEGGFFQLNEVIAHTISVGMLNEQGEMVCIPLIRRNTRLPAKAFHLASTAHSFQPNVVLPVFRGETLSVADNNYIGELQMFITEPKKDLIPLQIHLTINTDGILEVVSSEMGFTKEGNMKVVQKVRAIFKNAMS